MSYRAGTHFTTRGTAMLGCGVLLAVAAWLFGIAELYGLGAAAVVAVLAARLRIGLRPDDLAVIRVVRPQRVAAGQEARVELAITNRGRRTSAAVEARDPFDGGRRWARFSIAPLRPGEARHGSYSLPSSRRGVYHLGPLELWWSDPLGLVTRALRTADDTTLTVHPVWERVPVRASSSHRDDDRRSPHALIGKGGNEFYALREYVPGDDLRHVHWPSTARIDDLVIRQPENMRRGRLTVAVDLRSGIADEETVERMLSAAASVALSALEQGRQARVVTSAGWDSGHGEGRPHGPAVLDGLAAARVHQVQPAASPFRLAGRTDPVVVITSDRCSAADLESAVGQGGPAGTTVVMFSTPGGRPQAVNRRTVLVGQGLSFASVWRQRETVQ